MSSRCFLLALGTRYGVGGDSWCRPVVSVDAGDVMLPHVRGCTVVSVGIGDSIWRW